ncbi:MAG: D-3-phosphoglycerate dehydrogenase [Caulobacteraceae bacterium]|nr:D-3-phosphoglycerate dehydrogenase [Caulobacteraceae bacterium]
MSQKSSVYVAFPVLPEVRSMIEGRCAAQFNDSGKVLSRQELAQAAEGCSAVMVIMSNRLDAEGIALLPACVRTIATYTVGYDHIDVPAAKARGMAVLNTPEVLTDATAETAMLLLLGACRRATESIAMLREGRWTGWTPVQLPGWQLSGRRLGILGLGRIGAAIATRAAAFGMEVHYHGPRRRPADQEAGVLYHANEAEFLALSQVLLLAAPSNPQTLGFLNARRIAALPDGAIVINIARGGLVEDDALIEALKSGKLAAAGLDVFNNEPQLDPRYLDLPTAFLLPHIGSSTYEARMGMGRILVDGLDALARGESPSNLL